jgi:hypothetical protein
VPGQQKERVWHEGRHEPLIAPAVFERIALILDARPDATRRLPTRKTEALLSGMFTCVCGSALTLASKGTGYEQYRYQCNLRKRSRGLSCSTAALNGALVEPAVLKLLLRGLRVRLNQIRAAGG